MLAVETDQKVELEAMIKDLEEENRSVYDLHYVRVIVIVKVRHDISM